MPARNGIRVYALASVCCPGLAGILLARPDPLNEKGAMSGPYRVRGGLPGWCDPSSLIRAGESPIWVWGAPTPNVGRCVMQVWCGLDQGEIWNEFAVTNAKGMVLGRARVHADPDGVKQIKVLLRKYAGRSGPVTVITEGSSGLLMSSLAASGLDVRTI